MRKTLLLAVRCYAIVKIASVAASASSTVASTAFSGITPKKRVKASAKPRSGLNQPTKAQAITYTTNKAHKMPRVHSA